MTAQTTSCVILFVQVAETCRNPTADISRHEYHVRYVLTTLRRHLLMTDPTLCSDACRGAQPLLLSRIISTVKAPHKRPVPSWSRGTPSLLQLQHNICKVGSCNADRNIATSLCLSSLFHIPSVETTHKTTKATTSFTKQQCGLHFKLHNVVQCAGLSKNTH